MQTIPSLTFGEAIKLCFQNYAKCSGRSRRSEFWYFYLLCFIISSIMSVVFFPISDSMIEYDGYYYRYSYSSGFFIFLLIFFIVCIALIIPSISVSVRRLHDTGRSGVYYFVTFIPLVGPFLLLYFCSIDSEEHVNEYGPSPKYILPLNQPVIPAPVTVVPVPVPVPAPVSPYPQPSMAQGVPTYSQPPIAQPVPTYNQPPMAQPVPYTQPGQMPSQPYMPPPQPITYPGQQIPPPYPQ